ncbi:protein indeterminate-domain 4, chloroplastic-like [Zingiber officinale]|uniref:protein indeterminate-domain 4, chloroplastic-like n=1 Tax=Zingiber officinale TaxID=94328 RepID=UPI001C4BA005|nr:protein indeterminate-domain 4, chloroplastic-like [Zingiber officinale]
MKAPAFSSSPPSPPQQQPGPPSAAVSQSAAPPKKKRNLPGNPNPGAEVIALSPKTLLATSRFVCQVCGKGFQREQNLQLHRRGHNLPWNLKRKSPDERRRVYLCPEPTCAHHDPSRALGDLTGVKKHYCRKHGEKRWKCDQCSRRYAVLSDWKAHAKICGTREYRCHCGILFSRRDSYITHRAFCDALAQENARLPPATGMSGAAISGHLYANKGVSYLGLPQFNSHLPAAGGSTNTHEQSFNVDVPHLDTASFRPLPRSSHGQPYLAGEGRYDDLHGFNFEDPPPLLEGAQFGFGASSSSGNNYFNKNLNFFPTAGKNEEDQSGGGHLVGPAPGGGNDATAMPLLLASELMGHQAIAGSNMSMTPSLYDPGPSLPQSSATVTLRKAAQLGATSSFTGGIGGGSLRSNERQYQKTMNSLGGGEFSSDHLMAAGGFRLAMQPDDVEKEKLSTRNFLASAAP